MKNLFALLPCRRESCCPPLPIETRGADSIKKSGWINFKC